MSSGDLSEAATKLNAAIEELNEAIRSRGCNVVAHVPLEERLMLGWEKNGNKWQLVTVFKHNNGDEDVQALVNATWRRRVEAVRHIDGLLQQIEAETSAAVQQIEGAVAFTAALARNLKKKPEGA